MDTKIKTVAIALGLSDIFDPLTQRLIDPLDGSIARFDKTVAGIPCTQSTVIVATAGYERDFPLTPSSKHPVSLAKQLERFVKIYRQKWYPLLIAEPCGWGTSSEILNGIRLAIEKAGADPNQPVRLIIATNWPHVWRCRIYAERIKPAAWTVEVRRAKHYFSLKDTFREFGAYAHELMLFRPQPTDWNAVPRLHY